MTIRTLLIIPDTVLALSLQDIVAEFGAASLSLCAWAWGILAVMLLVWKLGGKKLPAAPRRDSCASTLAR